MPRDHEVCSTNKKQNYSFIISHWACYQITGHQSASLLPIPFFSEGLQLQLADVEVCPSGTNPNMKFYCLHASVVKVHEAYSMHQEEAEHFTCKASSDRLFITSLEEDIIVAPILQMRKWA